MDELNTRRIDAEEADLSIEFDSGAKLLVFGLDDSDKLLIRESSETKREKSIHGKDLVSVYLHTDGGREIVDWPLNDDNARSEGFWAWMERIITHPEVQASPIDGDLYDGTPQEREG